MGTVLADWRSYDRKVVPADAPTIQREECRRAFYAGAFAMFQLVMEATLPDDEALCERQLAAIEAEARAITDDLRIR